MSVVEHTRYVSVVEHTRYVSVVEQNDFNDINNQGRSVDKSGQTEAHFSFPGELTPVLLDGG